MSDQWKPPEGAPEAQPPQPEPPAPAPPAPQPPAPQTPQPQQPYGYQPPPPQQPYGYQPVAQQPKKKRTGCIIAAVVAGIVLLLLCAFVAVAGYFLYTSNAKTQAAIEDADGHYATALGIVQQLGQGATKTGSVPGNTKSFSDKAAGDIDRASSALEAAKEDIGALDDSEGKTKYLASIDELSKSLESLGQMVAFAGKAGGLLEKTLAAADKSRQGSEALNAAVLDNNADRHVNAELKSARAEKLFSEAYSLFMAADKIDHSAGLDKAAAYILKLKKKAALNKQLAQLGKKGSVNGYNKVVKQTNAIDKQIADMPQPDIITDPNWGQDILGELSDEAAGHAEKAQDLMEEAVEALQ